MIFSPEKDKPSSNNGLPDYIFKHIVQHNGWFLNEFLPSATTLLTITEENREKISHGSDGKFIVALPRLKLKE
ncbi:MAG: hypothetical protein EH225_07470, partial [Calditrichaeota bacterium]